VDAALARTPPGHQQGLRRREIVDAAPVRRHRVVMEDAIPFEDQDAVGFGNVDRDAGSARQRRERTGRPCGALVVVRHGDRDARGQLALDARRLGVRRQHRADEHEHEEREKAREPEHSGNVCPPGGEGPEGRRRRGGLGGIGDRGRRLGGRRCGLRELPVDAPESGPSDGNDPPPFAPLVAIRSGVPRALSRGAPGPPANRREGRRRSDRIPREVPRDRPSPRALSTFPREGPVPTGSEGRVRLSANGREGTAQGACRTGRKGGSPRGRAASGAYGPLRAPDRSARESTDGPSSARPRARNVRILDRWPSARTVGGGRADPRRVAFRTRTRLEYSVPRREIAGADGVTRRVTLIQ
jgi:hypothetical protein